MSVANSANLLLIEPVTGTESGNWGYEINYGTTEYLDIAVAGTNNITTDADVTLTQTTGSSSGSNIVGTTAQYAVLNLSGSRAGTARSIIVPYSTVAGSLTTTVASKTYVVVNNTTITYTIKKTGGTGVSVLPGETAIVYANPVVNDVVKITSSTTLGAITATTVTVTGSITNPATVGAINYGTLNYQDTNIVNSAQASFNGYVYSNIQNTSSGAIASTDFAIYNNNAYYVNAGINSSNYGASVTVGGTGGSSSTTLTVASVTSGNLLYGSVITGTGISGTVTITTQLTATGSAAASPTYVSGGGTSSNQFYVSSLAGIAIGYLVSGTGVPSGTFVGSFTSTGNGINLVNAAGTNVNFTIQAAGTYNFYVPGGVGTYTMSSAQTIASSTTITGQVAGSFNQPNNGYLYSFNGDLVVGTYSANPLRLTTNNNAIDGITIGTSNQIAFNGSYGTSGQALLSGGSGAAPTWGTLSSAYGGTGVANNAASTITISGNYASTFVVSGAYSYTFPAATDTLVNLGSSQTLTNKTLTNPTITAYLETAPAIANSSTAVTLSLSSGTVLSYTLTGNCTFTMPTATSGTSFILKLIQDGTGSRTATFTGVKWPGGTAPTITTTASTGLDILSFVCINSVWYGTYAQAFA